MTARQLEIVDGVQDQIWTIGPANSAGIIVAEMDRSRALRWRDAAGPATAPHCPRTGFGPRTGFVAWRLRHRRTGLCRLMARPPGDRIRRSCGEIATAHAPTSDCGKE